MKSVMLRGLLPALLVLSVPNYSAAQSQEKGKALCYQIQNMIDTLVDYTKTECHPASGSNGSLTIILVATTPIFHVEAAKKAWALVAVAAVGNTLNKSPSVRVDELWLSDVNEMKGRTAYVMRADKVKSLQRRAKADQFDDLDQMCSEISSSLTRKKVP